MDVAASNPHRVRKLQRLAPLLAAVAGALGLVLAAVGGGATAGIGLAGMAAASVLAHTRDWRRGTGKLLALAVAGLPLAPGGLPPETSVGFLVIGTAVAFSGRWTHALALLVAASGLQGLGALFYDLRLVLPALTGLAFFCLAGSVLCARPHVGLIRLVAGETTGHAMLLLLPVVALGPPVLGWLRWRGELAGLHQTALGPALLAAANVLLVCLVAWIAARPLLRSEARRRSVLGASLDSIISTDGSGIVADLNAAAERTFGYTREQAIGRHLVDLIFPVRLRRAYRDAIETCGAGGEAELIGRRAEVAAMRADGSEFPAEVAIFPERSDDELTFTGFVHDLSERKRAEEMRARTVELEGENWRVAQASRMRGELFANMSHELRTPLNAIIGFSEILVDGRAGRVSPDQAELLEEVLDSARSLLHFIDVVLDMSAAAAGKLPLQARKVDVGATVQEIAAMLAGAAAHKRIQVAVEVDPTLGEVEIDPRRLKQVVHAYLSHALKVTAWGEQVVVRARGENAEQFRIEVEPRPADHTPETMERWFLAVDQGGPWLGLALTRQLVEAQGGSAGAEGGAVYAVLPRRASIAGFAPR